MTSRVIIPFNFAPVSSSRGTTGSYTVPSGKYARITITVSHSFYPSTGFVGVLGVTTSAESCHGDGFQGSFDIWMKSGEVLSLSNTNTNGSAAISSNGGAVGRAALNALANISSGITVNSVLWRNIISRASFSLVATVPQAGFYETNSLSIYMNCESSVSWWAEEYNAIT